MKNKILFLSLLSFFLISTADVLAIQDMGTTQMNIAAPSGLQQKIKEKTETRTQNIEQKKQEIKARVAEKNAQRIRTIYQNMGKRFQHRLALMEKHALRLEEMCDMFREKGADVSEAEAKIAEARTAMQTAQEEFGASEAKLDELLGSTEPKAVLPQLKDIVRKAEQNLKTARLALTEAVKLLKAQKQNFNL